MNGFDKNNRRIKNWDIKRLEVGQILSETFYYKVVIIQDPKGDIEV